MLGCAAWRAVRLVVDSGLHARGWSRARAREFALAHSPMPEGFVDAEMDRYIALPGQALGYLIGQREILRLRDDARSRLGTAFDIRDFHSAVLDHGSLPLPVLAQVVAEWAAAAAKRVAGAENSAPVTPGLKTRAGINSGTGVSGVSSSSSGFRSGSDQERPVSIARREEPV
jgi:hypothetical protein